MHFCCKRYRMVLQQLSPCGHNPRDISPVLREGVHNMKSSISMRLAALAATGMLVAGCATDQQNRTAVGTGAGAALGAGLGALIGDSSKAAMIGAGIGAVAGGVAGHNWDRIKGNINQSGA